MCSAHKKVARKQYTKRQCKTTWRGKDKNQLKKVATLIDDRENDSFRLKHTRSSEKFIPITLMVLSVFRVHNDLYRTKKKERYSARVLFLHVSNSLLQPLAKHYTTTQANANNRTLFVDVRGEAVSNKLPGPFKPSGSVPRLTN